MRRAGGRAVCLPPSPTHPLHPSDLPAQCCQLYQFNRSSLKRNILDLRLGLRYPGIGIRSPAGAKKNLLQNPDRLWSPPVFITDEYPGLPPPQGKAIGSEADDSPSYSVVANNERRYTSSPTHMVMAWFLNNDRAIVPSFCRLPYK